MLECTITGQMDNFQDSNTLHLPSPLLSVQNLLLPLVHSRLIRIQATCQRRHQPVEEAMPYTRTERRCPMYPMPAWKSASHIHPKASRWIHTWSTIPRSSPTHTETQHTNCEADKSGRERRSEDLLLSWVETDSEREENDCEAGCEFDREGGRWGGAELFEQKAPTDLEVARVVAGAEEEACECSAQELERHV